MTKKHKLYETEFICPKCNIITIHETDYKITKLPKCNKCNRRMKRKEV